ncbi:MAG: Crp/Fnr family transcriptional regulator [Sphingobium sp.]
MDDTFDYDGVMGPQDVAMLERERWFGGLSPALRTAMLSRVTLHSLRAGRHIYRLGDPPNGLHVLLEGQIRLLSYTPAGMDVVSMVVRPGLWFGELSVLDGKERPHDAITDTAVRMARLPMAAVADLTSRDPGIWRAIALLSCEHQRMGLRNTARIQTQSAIVRLTGFLLGRVAKASDGVVRLTQDDLAQIVGVSRQRINALIALMKAQAIVNPVYGGLAIADPEALRLFLQSVREEEEGI